MIVLLTPKEQNKAESLTPAELFKKHLKDPSHHVTDEELRNLKVGTDAEDEEQVIKESNDIKEEIEHLPDNDSLPNPYEILE